MNREEYYNEIKENFLDDLCRYKPQRDRNTGEMFILDESLPESVEELESYIRTEFNNYACCFDCEKLEFDLSEKEENELAEATLESIVSFYRNVVEERRLFEAYIEEKARKRYEQYKDERTLAYNTMKKMKKIGTGKIRTIVIDTETTGLNAEEDEILQLSIIDDDGNVLLNELYKPKCHSSWEKAQAVNRISPQKVSNCPHIISDIPRICEIICNAEIIIGYNTSFDLDFIENLGIEPKDNCMIIDVMRDFAEIYGEWSNHYDSYKWQKLITCAAYYDYDWGTDVAHDSLADCRATLHCYKKMSASKEKA